MEPQSSAALPQPSAPADVAEPVEVPKDPNPDMPEVPKAPNPQVPKDPEDQVNLMEIEVGGCGHSLKPPLYPLPSLNILRFYWSRFS